ncbi:hypothetical protein [Qipengyuania sp.]|uniref:hypothetical protein n=1 Tax=Qipengyuania sp. TaxID=2004515 RepID=UPI003735DD0F
MNTANLTSNLIEAANRAEATALLIRANYKVYRPEADDNGEDLVLRFPTGELVPVQLKGRLHVEQQKYYGKDIWMLFPCSPWSTTDRRTWFLVPHDDLFIFMKGCHGHADGFAAGKWSVRTPSKKQREFLMQYELKV